MMRIRNIQCLFLYFPFERALGNSLAWLKGKNCNMIKLETEDGLVGYGDAYSFDSEILYRAFNGLIPHLIGFSFASWEELLVEIRSRIQGKITPYYQGSIESAFNLAYWDIQGKAENKPVCAFFGAEPREKIPVYGTGLFYREVDDYKAQLPLFLEEAERFMERGYHGIKMKAGRYPVEQEFWLIERIRQALPEEMLLMVDANCGMKSSDETKALIRRLEQINVKWLEEPFQPDAYMQYKETTESCDRLPIAAGENEYDLTGFLRLIDAGVTIFQPELSLCGGFSQLPELLKMAGQHHIQLTPHIWGSGFLYGACLNFYSMLGSEHALPFEVPLLSDPFRDQCFHQINIERGHISTPKAAGLGVETDEKEIGKYLLYPIK